ncbi:probable G-protein coupled receptor Mth-like 3 isoform X1 [Anoplolepis gracilipes]|uniref:probable G-protein coupled receptor Mth-like 3 isoform X1 n=2 Tax=Anoplolepis gracilipes TaxID=354296 RepID=UPI003BA0DBCE
MYRKSFEFWCCALLFFVSSTKPLQNFTIDNKQDNNLVVRYELHVNSTERNGNETIFNRHNLRKNFTMDYEDAQDVFRINFRSNSRKDVDWIQNEFLMHYVKYPEKRNRLPREIRANFTKVGNKNHINNENNNENYIVPYETCDNRTCIRLCCPLGNRYNLLLRNCTEESPKYVFSDVYKFWNETNMQTEYKKIDEMFQLIVQNPCPEPMKFVRINLNDDYWAYYKYVFFENGTLYLSYLGQFVESTSYCLAFLNHDEVIAITCTETLTKIMEERNNYTTTVLRPLMDDVLHKKIGFICVVVPFLCMLMLLLVYTILPELHNIHGFMLRQYSSIVSILYLNHLFLKIVKTSNLAYSICIASGLVGYFSSVACNFWLCVMSFDMWWTFRNFSSLKKKANQQENNRKKVLYSIFVWGISFFFVIICIIMDFVPSVPKSMIRPRFQLHTCWFRFGASDKLYNFVPKFSSNVISIILSIHTALKIMRYEKDTVNRLQGAESRCYNENKKWANLYLKLFIMLFIIIAMEIIMATVLDFWIRDYTNLTIFFIVLSIFILKSVKGIGIFILFVCKKTIIQMLLKRFRQNRRYRFKIFKRKGFYNFEHVSHNIEHMNSVEKYKILQNEGMDKEFVQ